MPSNEHATATGSSAPRFGRVNCLDAEAFAQLCARLDPMPGNPGELSEGLPVCHIPARKGSSIGRYRVRTCWNDDDEDFVRAGVLPEVRVEKKKTWRGKVTHMVTAMASLATSISRVHFMIYQEQQAIAWGL
ncbi:unnamed protein product [Symbiodinium natans]|uniref:Uncharacterized protein n=1 Tax=Symbiodinium natans TaxID=878477 RepID=A0A812L1H8_9DINO|nr:unnamed protein product [Symbiodinium natans]